MQLNEMTRQALTRMTTMAVVCGMSFSAAHAAPTTADFESLTGSTPGTNAGPNTTTFVSQENNTGNDANPPSIENDGSIAAINDYLRLVPEAGSENNRAGFDLTHEGLYHTINARFDFRFTSTAGGTADGLGLALIRTDVHGVSGAGPGFSARGAPAQSLQLGLDNYDNGPGPGHEDPSNNHAEFNFDADRLAVSDINTGDLNMSDGNWHRAELSLRYVTGGTRATLVMTPDYHGAAGTPVTVFDNQYLPGVLPYEARLSLVAHTGGADAAHDIDNIQVDYSLNNLGFNFDPDFAAATASQFEFNNNGNGSTGLVADGGTTFLQVTTNNLSQTGSAWLKQKQLVADGFVSEFDFEFPNISPDGFSGSLGADGMGFIIHNNASLDGYNPGRFGGGGTFALELDSFKNGDSEPSAALLAIRKDGNRLVTIDLDSAMGISNLSDSGVHSIRIEYANGLMDVLFDGVLLIDDQAVSLDDIADGAGRAYLGFSANTGGEGEEHNVYRWSFVSAVPEPTTFAMLALGGLSLIRRRRNA